MAILEFSNHGNNTNCIKPIVMLIKKVLIIILFFGKLYRTNVVSMAIHSHNQLKFLNSVTLATTKIA